jgi:hypothetical protein
MNSWQSNPRVKAAQAWVLVLLCASLLMGGCAQRSLLPEQGYLVSQSRMTEQVGKRFPISKNFNDLVDVTASAPQLEMDSVRNRVRAAISMDVDSRLFKTQKHYQGVMRLSSALRFDAGKKAIVLQSPTVEHFDLGAEAEARMGLYKPIAVSMLSKWLESELDGYVVYQLPASSEALLGHAPRLSIVVQNDGILFLPQ